MELDTQIAILHSNNNAVGDAVACLSRAEQENIMANGGEIVLASGKSPNGMDCTLVARIAANRTGVVVAVSGDGREQVIAPANVAKVKSMIK